MKCAFPYCERPALYFVVPKFAQHRQACCEQCKRELAPRGLITNVTAIPANPVNKPTNRK